MKLTKLLSLAILMVASVAPAALFDSGTNSVGAAIPDANPADPIASSLNVTMPTGNDQVGDLRLSVTLNGGYNGDLYAYLEHGSDFGVLLNRVGSTGSDLWGYSDPGLTVSFVAAGGTGYFGTGQGDIHTYRDVLGVGIPTGQWYADGGGLSKFLNTDGNGDWTLAIFDLATGQQSTLTSWQLQIDAVPEPTALGVGILGLLIGLVCQGRIRRWVQG
jgi:subtilisin-like proprotein convertase family protein